MWHRTSNYNTPSTLDADFAKFQERLSSQSRRMDSVDATLGMLAVLQFAALAYLFENVAASNAWSKLVAFDMLVPLALSLIGVLGFAGSESPELDSLLDALHRSRDRALHDGIVAMASSFEESRQALQQKERAIKVSTGLFAVLFGMDIILLFMLK